MWLFNHAMFLYKWWLINKADFNVIIDVKSNKDYLVYQCDTTEFQVKYSVVMSTLASWLVQSNGLNQKLMVFPPFWYWQYHEGWHIPATPALMKLIPFFLAILSYSPEWRCPPPHVQTTSPCSQLKTHQHTIPTVHLETERQTVNAVLGKPNVLDVWSTILLSANCLISHSELQFLPICIWLQLQPHFTQWTPNILLFIYRLQHLSVPNTSPPELQEYQH